MTLPIVRVLRKITVGAMPGMKFLIRPKRRKAIGFEELAKRMQAHSSLTKADAYAAMIQMQDEVLAELMEGNPVSLGKLGTLTPMFRAKAVDTLEEANENTITRKYLRYTPSVEVRKLIQDIPVELDKTDQIKGLQPSSNNTEQPTNP